MNYTASEAFKDLVLTCDSVTGLIAARFYPNVAPQTVLDSDPEVYAVYSALGELTPHHLGGPSDISEARFQVDVFARKYVDARAVSEAIREAVDGYAGEVSGKNGSMEIRGVRLEDTRDGYEYGDSSEAGWHRVSMDFAFWHRQSVPLTVAG